MRIFSWKMQRSAPVHLLLLPSHSAHTELCTLPVEQGIGLS